MHEQQHTPECLARQKVHAEYLEKWPDHCEDCHGWGGRSYPDRFDYKAGVGEPGGYDPCLCTEQGNCPRCGGPGLTSEERGDSSTGDGPCKLCGWTEQDGGLAEVDCDCWYAKEYEPEIADDAR